jgi:hypothetical protein
MLEEGGARSRVAATVIVSIPERFRLFPGPRGVEVQKESPNAPIARLFDRIHGGP